MNKELRNLPADAVKISTKNPRKSINNTSLDEMAESIKAQGILQPLTEETVGTGNCLLSCERRLKGAKVVDLDTVPCVAAPEISDNAADIQHLIKSMAREDLTPMDLSLALRNLVRIHPKNSLEELADQLGMSRTRFYQCYKLADLPKEVHSYFRDVLEDGSTLTQTHGEALFQFRKDGEPSVSENNLIFIKLAEKAYHEHLSSWQLMSLVEKALNPEEKLARDLSDKIQTAVERLTKTYGDGVKIEPKGDGFVITIEKADIDDLDKVLSMMNVVEEDKSSTQGDAVEYYKGQPVEAEFSTDLKLPEVELETVEESDYGYAVLDVNESGGSSPAEVVPPAFFGSGVIPGLPFNRRSDKTNAAAVKPVARTFIGGFPRAPATIQAKNANDKSNVLSGTAVVSKPAGIAVLESSGNNSPLPISKFTRRRLEDVRHDAIIDPSEFEGIISITGYNGKALSDGVKQFILHAIRDGRAAFVEDRHNSDGTITGVYFYINFDYDAGSFYTIVYNSGIKLPREISAVRFLTGYGAYISAEEAQPFIEDIRNGKTILYSEDNLHAENLKERVYVRGNDKLTITCHPDWAPEGEEKLAKDRRAMARYRY